MQAGDLLTGIGTTNKDVMIVIVAVMDDGIVWTYQVTPWVRRAVLNDKMRFFLSAWAVVGTACVDCGEDDCDGSCFMVDGRDIECVAEYASTCDGCAELTSHEDMEMDTETQLGYCPICMKNGNYPESMDKQDERKEDIIHRRSS